VCFIFSIWSLRSVRAKVRDLRIARRAGSPDCFVVLHHKGCGDGEFGLVASREVRGASLVLAPADDAEGAEREEGEEEGDADAETDA